MCDWKKWLNEAITHPRILLSFCPPSWLWKITSSFLFFFLTWPLENQPSVHNPTGSRTMKEKAKMGPPRLSVSQSSFQGLYPIISEDGAPENWRMTASSYNGGWEIAISGKDIVTPNQISFCNHERQRKTDIGSARNKFCFMSVL